jgi:TolB protein
VRDGEVVPLTDSLSLNLSPVWSPDGRRVYYISNRFGPKDIFAQEVAGDTPRGPALRLTTGLNAHTISLSADGRRLAYADLALESNAWSVPIPAHPQGTSAEATQLTHGSQYLEQVNLSPDGRWLYYDSDLSGNMDLYRMALPGGSPERLTTDPSDDFFAVPSPDGREVAFHSWRSGSRDIWVAPLDGGPVQRVTSSPAQEAMPSWAPDGDRLAYAIFSGQGGIWTVRRVNGAWQRPVERTRFGFFPHWSPDGRSLVFTSALSNGALWIAPADSGAPRLLADTTGPTAVRGDQIWWSDDGRTFYTRSADAEDNSLFWSVSLDGGVPRRLFTLQAAKRAFGWCVGNGRLVYTATERRSDVWVMEVLSGER